MLQETKAKEIEVVVGQPEKPMFTEEFLRMMQDYAYETLRRYLENSKQDIAVQLLDDLVMLAARGQCADQENWIQDQFMSEAVGAVSHHVLALGGRFYSSSEIMTPFK